jgi:hypothetical protein
VSQIMLVNPVLFQKQELLSLNMRGVDDLFPGFAPGDFGVVCGASSVAYLASLLCVRAQLPNELGGLNSNVVFIDGGNMFWLYQVAHLATLHHLDKHVTLEQIHLSRAFTAYQLTSLILNKLKELVEQFDAKFVIISDFAGLFLDKNIPDEEALRVFSQIVAYIQSFVREKQIVLLAIFPPHSNSRRSEYLEAVTCGRANVVLSLKQSKYDREVVLEKHHRLMVGSAVLPSDNVTLDEFMQ